MEQKKWNVSLEDIDRIFLLKDVAYEAVQGILSSCEVIYVTSGEVVVEYADVKRSLYVVLEGELQEYPFGDYSLTPKILTSGKAFCISSALKRIPVSQSVVAKSDARILIIPELQFWRLVDVSHEFSRNIIYHLSEKEHKIHTLKSTGVQLPVFEMGSTSDPLTTLHNRRWFTLNLPKLVHRARFGTKDISLLLLDINKFKRINEKFGLLTGDLVLRTYAEIIRQSIRPYDFACRFGGDQFVVIYTDTTQEEAVEYGHRICSRIEHFSSKESYVDELPKITMSGGVSSLLQIDDSVLPVADIVTALITTCETALAVAKKKGKPVATVE